MADYNATVILDKIREEQAELLTPTSQSLNAGSELDTDPPVDDGTVIEVKVDIKTIADLMPLADDISTGAQALEQRHTELAYLREDINVARGMNQSLAAEAISIMPDFGMNRPLSHYSRHVSNTRYTAALEEIDAVMLADAMTYLETLDRRFQTINKIGTDFAEKGIDRWESARAAVPEFANKVSNAISVLAAGGYVWSDQELIDTTVNRLDEFTAPAVKAYLTTHLYTNTGALQAIAQKGPYWRMGQEIPMYMDMFADHLSSWDTVLDSYCHDLEGSETIPKCEIPTLGAFNLPNGSSTKPIDLGAAYWQSEADAMVYKKPGDISTILSVLSNVADSVQYASTPDVIARMRNIGAVMESRRGTLASLRRILGQTPSSADIFPAMVTDIVRLATALTNDYLAYFNFLTAAVAYEDHMIAEVNKMCHSVLVVVDTIDGELLNRPRAAYTFQVEFLDKWKTLRDELRKTVEYLY